MENLVDLYIFNQILSKSIELGSVTMTFVVAYRFLTVQKTRNQHHRIMRAMMFRIHRVSWFNLTKNASFSILKTLNKIYGKTPRESRLFSTEYFNQRSWTASFTIALTYIVLGLLIAPVLIFETEYEPEKSYYIATLMAITAIFYKLKEKIQKKTIPSDKYRLSIISIIYILATSAIFNLTNYNPDYLLVIITICIPLLLVWKNGFNGLIAYLFSLALYLSVMANIVIISYAATTTNNIPQHASVSQTQTKEVQQQDAPGIEKQKKTEDQISTPQKKASEIQNPRVNYEAFFFNALAFFIAIVFKHTFDQKKYSYKKFYKTLLFTTAILCPIILAYKNSTNAAILYIITWVYILYALLFIWGIVVSNSISDLISSNVSRWLFLKIQKYKLWREIFFASIVDLIIGSSLVLFTSLLIGSIFSSLYIFLSDSSPISIYKYAILVSNVITTIPDNSILIFTKEFNLSYVTSPILHSYHMALQHVGIHIENTNSISHREYLRLFNKLGYTLWYMYISTLIPTILHMFFVKLLLIAKTSNHFFQKPALYVHKLLLEENADDGYFGKAFSGTARATVFIGFAFAATSMMIYAIILAIIDVS